MRHLDDCHRNISTRDPAPGRLSGNPHYRTSGERDRLLEIGCGSVLESFISMGPEKEGRNMANLKLLVNFAVFSFLIYALFLVTVQFTDTPSHTVMGLKYTGYEHHEELVRLNAANVFQTPAGDPFSTGISPDVRPRENGFSEVAKNPSTLTIHRTTEQRRAEIEYRRAGQGAITEIRRPNISIIGTLNSRGRPSKSNSSGIEPLSNHGARASNEQNRCVIRILFWCDDAVRFNGSFRCRHAGCRLLVTRSVDVSDLEGAEIVVFYHRGEKPWDELIRFRPLGQMWVFFSRESRPNCPTCLPPKSYGRVFNISMTHLRDSDILVPYGRYIPYGKAITGNRREHHTDRLANKSRHVLWVASNCNHSGWDRVGFVEHLSQYTDVDAYGRCGSLTCPRDEKDYCQKLFMQYKFYLALENSHCQDYITEKVWSNSLGNTLVPVVFGASREDYEKALPPDSFVFAEDFNSTRELASFLDTVGRNATRYGEFFKWREHGQVSRWTRSLTFKPAFFCRIFSELKTRQSGSDGMKNERNISVEEWWRTSCRKLERLNFADLQSIPDN